MNAPRIQISCGLAVCGVHPPAQHNPTQQMLIIVIFSLLQVLGLALFFALVIKKPDQDEDVDPGLEKGEEYLHKHEKQSQKLTAKVRRKLNKYKNIPLPPTEEYLAAARAMR